MPLGSFELGQKQDAGNHSALVYEHETLACNALSQTESSPVGVNSLLLSGTCSWKASSAVSFASALMDESLQAKLCVIVEDQ